MERGLHMELIVRQKMPSTVAELKAFLPSVSVMLSGKFGHLIEGLDMDSARISVTIEPVMACNAIGNLGYDERRGGGPPIPGSGSSSISGSPSGSAAVTVSTVDSRA